MANSPKVERCGNVFIAEKIVVNEHRPVQNPPASECDSGEATVDKVSQFLQQHYSTSLKTFSQNPLKTEQTSIQKAFTNPVLKFIDKVDGKCTISSEAPHSMDNVFRSRDDQDSPYRVLIFGNPGTGKTLICQKYAYDWGNSKCSSPFKKFKIVIFLKLCDAKGSFREVLESRGFFEALSNEEKEIENFFSYMNEHPDEFLFLLDGVDECNLNELPDIQSFLMNTKYIGVHLIATVCPDPTSKWLSMCHTFHLRYVLTGYSEDNLLEFVSKYFKYSPTKSDFLKNYINDTPELKRLAQIPLILLVLCEFWNEKDNLPTLTVIIDRYVKLVLDLFEWKIGKKNKNKSPENEVEFVARDDLMSTHAEFALERVMKNYSATSEVKCLVGFLGVAIGENIKNSYTFPHEKIQEYFAAWWMVKRWGSEDVVRKLEQMLSDSEIAEYSSVLVFIAGLLAEEQDDGAALVMFLNRLATINNNENCLECSCYDKSVDLLLSCVHEAWRSEVSSATINEKIMGLFRGFQPFKNSKTANGVPRWLSQDAARGLAEIVAVLCRSSNLTKLNLSGILIHDEGAKVIATKCLQENCYVDSVNFSHSFLGPVGVKALCVAAKTMKRLKYVNFSSCYLGDEGVKAIAELINVGDANIISLHLAKNLDKNFVQKDLNHHLTRTNSWARIAESIEEKFKDQNTCPGNEAIKVLIAAIEEENEIEYISLPSCCVGDLINEWLRVFRENEKLKRIEMCLKILDKRIGDSLVQTVMNMKQLEGMSVILEDDRSINPKDFSSQHELEDRTDGKLSLKIDDHTHSLRTKPFNMMYKVAMSSQTG